MIKLYLTVILVGGLFLTSCSLWKANEWNSYKVILEAQDEAGQVLNGVNILSTARHENKTNKLGRVTLFYSQRGLHIVTIQAAGMITKQIKVKIPDDANKIVIFNLKSK